MPRADAIAARPVFPMHKISRLLIIAALTIAPVFAARDLGSIEVKVEGQTIPVRVTASSPDLLKLAQEAFNSHGRYKVVASGHAYEFKFTATSANQVRLDMTKGSAATPIGSQVVNGSSPHHALLRAADVAVENTNGLTPSLRGFFTARLAFISHKTGRSEVYTSDLFLRGAKQLTFDRAPALSPRWAPDGSRIVYTSYFKTGAPDIYLLDPVSTNKNIFANYRGTNTGARFSPNGQQIAMVLSSAQGSPEIFVKSTQGGAPVRKTHSDTVKSSPCWSPDGSQIVFAMGEPSPQLYVISASGGTAPRRVASGYAYMAEPDWSRTDRNKIVCTVRVPGAGFQIAVVDVASGSTKIVSKAVFDAVEPSWLADGRHVVCTVRDRRTSVLAILDTESGNSFPITHAVDGTAVQASVWTP
jgi:TolB protein